MKPILTKQTTAILGAPKGWDDSKGPCHGLPIVEAHGNLYSYWKPTLKERLLLMIGRPITLVVLSSSHPPVALEVQK